MSSHNAQQNHLLFLPPHPKMQWFPFFFFSPRGAPRYVFRSAANATDYVFRSATSAVASNDSLSFFLPPGTSQRNMFFDQQMPRIMFIRTAVAFANLNI